MANNSNCNNCFGWMENNKVCHKIAIHNISYFAGISFNLFVANN